MPESMRHLLPTIIGTNVTLIAFCVPLPIVLWQLVPQRDFLSATPFGKLHLAYVVVVLIDTLLSVACFLLRPTENVELLAYALTVLFFICLLFLPLFLWSVTRRNSFNFALEQEGNPSADRNTFELQLDNLTRLYEHLAERQDYLNSEKTLDATIGLLKTKWLKQADDCHLEAHTDRFRQSIERVALTTSKILFNYLTHSNAIRLVHKLLNTKQIGLQIQGTLHCRTNSLILAKNFFEAAKSQSRATAESLSPHLMNYSAEYIWHQLRNLSHIQFEQLHELTQSIPSDRDLIMKLYEKKDLKIPHTVWAATALIRSVFQFFPECFPPPGKEFVRPPFFSDVRAPDKFSLGLFMSWNKFKSHIRQQFMSRSLSLEQLIHVHFSKSPMNTLVIGGVVSDPIAFKEKVAQETARLLKANSIMRRLIPLKVTTLSSEYDF